MDRKCRGIDQAGCPTLSRAGWRQLGGLWFPQSLHEGAGGCGCVTACNCVTAKGVKATAPFATSHISTAPEGQHR